MFKHTSALFNNFQDHMELRRHTARTRVHFTNEQRYAANKMPIHGCPRRNRILFCCVILSTPLSLMCLAYTHTLTHSHTHTLTHSVQTSRVLTSQVSTSQVSTCQIEESGIEESGIEESGIEEYGIDKSGIDCLPTASPTQRV